MTAAPDVARAHSTGGQPGHSHGASADADTGKLTIALALIVGFMLVEVVVGSLVHSLALLSDAAHMLTDAGAIGLSLVAIRLAARPAKGAMTFGFKRAEILSAQFNGATLLVLALLIIYEAITRLVHPPNVGGTPVLVVALIGIVVNLAATWTLSKANRKSMNIEGAFQHILTDLAAFVFTAIAGVIILTTAFRRADGIASLVIAAIMLKAAYGLLRDSGRVFLEAAPEGLDPDEIGRSMLGQDGVRSIHDLHVWEVTSGFPSLSAHVLVGTDNDCHAVRRDLERLLRDEYDLEHTTLQVDHATEELLSIEPAPTRRLIPTDPRT
jgi:cobalt-zinc-cadmium efflux system protein